MVKHVIVYWTILEQYVVCIVIIFFWRHPVFVIIEHKCGCQIKYYCHCIIQYLLQDFSDLLTPLAYVPSKLPKYKTKFQFIWESTLCFKDLQIYMFCSSFYKCRLKPHTKANDFGERYLYKHVRNENWPTMLAITTYVTAWKLAFCLNFENLLRNWPLWNTKSVIENNVKEWRKLWKAQYQLRALSHWAIAIARSHKQLGSVSFYAMTQNIKGKFRDRNHNRSVGKDLKKDLQVGFFHCN